VRIEAWWTSDPHANVGIAVGAEAGILVFDIDPRNGGNKTLEKLEAELGPLPGTVIADTGGGGQHLYFTHPPFRVRKDNHGKLLGPGIDVLTDGCIVVAPPSRHASGHRYAWAKGKSFRNIEIAKLPRAWRGQLCNGTADVATADSPEPNSEATVAEGGRNTHLTSLAGSLHRLGTSPEVMLAALSAENNSRCNPPLDTSEVEGIIASIIRYPTQPLNTDDAAEALMQLTLDQHFSAGQHLLRAADGKFWEYDKRLWRAVADDWVSGKVLQVLQANPIRGQKTASLLAQVLALLKAKLAVRSDPLSFTAEPQPVINCANGELWIDPDGQVELRPHRPDSYLRHCLDVEYDPEATCPEYDCAVLEIFSKTESPEAMVRHWHELTGYIIQPSRAIPIVSILSGGGENGKTKLIGTTIRLLGSELVHAQRVDDLEKGRFAMGSLFGKYLFIDDDVRAGAKLPDGILKTISEAKTVTGERKYGPAFNFVVRTVPVLICNNVPSIADLSRGMQRRLMVIPFNRTFTKKDRDRHLFDRIWKSELSGVLNRALAGYQRVQKRLADFKYPGPVRHATTRFLQQANPLPAFIEEQSVKIKGNGCLVRDFYKAYSDWTKSMGYTLTQTQQTVDKNLNHLGYATKVSNRGKVIIGLDPTD